MPTRAVLLIGESSQIWTRLLNRDESLTQPIEQGPSKQSANTPLEKYTFSVVVLESMTRLVSGV